MLNCGIYDFRYKKVLYYKFLIYPNPQYKKGRIPFMNIYIDTLTKA